MVEYLPWIIAVVITVALWAMFQVFLNQKADRATQRLKEFQDPSLRTRGGGEEDGGMAEMFRNAAPALSKALQPKTELEQNNLKVTLANAGFNSPNAPQIYLALRFVSLIVGVLIGTGVGLLNYGIATGSLYSVVVCGGLGIYIPSLVLAYLKSARKKKIFLQMPDALDLLVVCVEAGLGLDAGMKKVAEELADTAPELCDDLDYAIKQLNLGRNRRDVLHDLGVRTGVDDMRALAAILIQADRFGSSIAQALRVQSDSMRTKRRQIAEEKAAATAVKMIFPLVLFIFPGIFVVLVGPAAILMMRDMLNK